MKSVLISIKPRWCELIFSGKKTAEVRKSRPKLKTPFKVYIYCTKDFKPNVKYGFKLWAGRGKVIGEFVCKKMETYPRRLTTFQDTVSGSYISKSEVSKTCLSVSELNDYFMGAAAYFWHISDLKIYDTPKPLSDFFHACSGKHTDCSKCYDLRENTCIQITRPPQSWCYVEEI